MARLGDYIEQIRGVSYKPEDVCTPEDVDAVAILRANNIQDDGLVFDDLMYVKKSKVSTVQYIKAGDIIVCASSGSKNLVGKAAMANEDVPISFGAFCKVVRPKKLTPSYLGHYFQCPKYRKKISELAGGANINNIRNEHIDELDITIVAEEEQAKIVCELDKVSSLIFLRKQQLSKFDELVKSRFIEMFGDPTLNPFGWKIVNIAEVVGGKVTNGFFAKRDEYMDDGNVKVLGVANIVNRMYSNVKDLPRTNGTASDIQKFEVRYGDMLFCRSSLVAEGIGKASIVPHDVPPNTLFECHVIRLPLDLNKCVPEFMQVLSTTDYFRNQVIAQSKTATMTTIGQDGILKTMIILPPIEKQKQFLEFVNQTDKSKFEIQKSLEKLETLKKALMQKYFG